MPERDAQLEQLVQIRKLLILLLLKSGSTSQEIARALKVDSSKIRHEMPTRVDRFAYTHLRVASPRSPKSK